MLGKYSPTVSAAYRENQKWFHEYASGLIRDVEGYDSYGYDEMDRDRAGVYEDEYMSNQILYDRVSTEWGFNGKYPVRVA